MKALFLLMALLAAMTVPALAEDHIFSRNLTVGSRGVDVVRLQDFLESKGLLVMPQGVAKGYFGSLTRAALAAYQVSVGITPAEGYFGPITRAVTNAEMAKKPKEKPKRESAYREVMITSIEHPPPRRPGVSF